MSKMTPEMARRIEREVGLATGDIACGREMSMAEEIYLKLPPYPPLAITVEETGSLPTLMLYDLEVGIGMKRYLKGAVHDTPEDARKDVKNLWGALTLARQNALEPIIGEDVAVVFTGWMDGNDGTEHLWSWSVAPSRIRDIFSEAPASMLLLPHFEVWPPEHEGKRSHGKFISRLGVQRVIYVYSIHFQSLSNLKQRLSSYIVEKAREPKTEIAQELPSRNLVV